MHQQADNQTGTCLPVSYGYDKKTLPLIPINAPLKPENRPLTHATHLSY